MDNVPKAVRSRIMAAIHPRGNTTTELAMGRLLTAAGIRGYRKHWPIEGKPDFAWPRLKVALFVDGCFWHACPYCHKPPESNLKYWRSKLDRNKTRDKKVSNRLRARGWSVLRIWECQVRRGLGAAKVARALDNRRLLIGRPT